MISDNSDSEADVSIGPSADYIRPSLSRMLEERFPDEKLCDYVQMLLDATCGKEGKPDCRSVEAGLRFVASYKIGLPTQRQEIITHKITSGPTVASLLANPATIEVLERMLAEAKGKMGDGDSGQLGLPSGQ